MLLPSAYEVNFDGLIGPTHNYSGLSFGNVASTGHRALVSNPQEAALQGLRKMKYLADLGLKQALLPPHERPHLSTLRNLGFEGSDQAIIEKAARSAPELFLACCSASSMWTANAATVAPSADTIDGKVHFTPANLINKFHRSIEHSMTSRILQTVFSDAHYFTHHSALPSSSYFGDEGGANHSRFCTEYGRPGLHLFVYGKTAFGPSSKEASHYPARQTFEASQAIMRLHKLDAKNVIFAQQSPDAIDAGVFHNDVASVGNRDVFFCHENAFSLQSEVLSELHEKFKQVSEGKVLTVIQVPASEVSLKDAVASYLFNTQIVQPPGKSKMTLIAPVECQEVRSVKLYLDQLLQDSTSPIDEIQYFDLRQSMRNGGGPACLRLRITLTQEELRASNSKVYLDEGLYLKLTQWVKKHYRDRITINELSDPQLLQENRTALDELTKILQLGSIYPFQ